MRHVFRTVVIAAFPLALLSLSPNAAQAGDSGQARCTCPEADSKRPRPKFADLAPRRLDESDELAALESIQVGLTRMDDGTAFVWKHANGRLSGIVRPTASFRNAAGDLCRHVTVLLTTGFKTRTAEGIACRASNRRWVLEG
jgi:hypothetical protein